MGAVGRSVIAGFTNEPHHSEDLHAWQVLRPLLEAGPYLPWSTGAMRPAALVDLEHDARWAKLVSELLDREQLGDIAQVVPAPLEGEPLWYARSAVTSVSGPIDLLVVDGPPAYAAGEGERRAPALAAFEDRLVPGAAVFLDDALRPGEQGVLATWEATTTWRFSVDDITGIALGQRRPS